MVSPENLNYAKPGIGNTDWYSRWCKELNEPARFHRKQWEYVYIMQALWERGCIEKGKGVWYLQLVLNHCHQYLQITDVI